MTASSPRGTFSQAELAGGAGDNPRCITRSTSVPGATIRAMPGELERLPAPAPGVGPVVLAAELLGRVRAELPLIGGLGEREQVLVAAWLTGLRSTRTRRAYAADVAAWLGWLVPQLLAHRPARHHADGPDLQVCDTQAPVQAACIRSLHAQRGGDRS